MELHPDIVDTKALANLVHWIEMLEFNAAFMKREIVSLLENKKMNLSDLWFELTSTKCLSLNGFIRDWLATHDHRGCVRAEYLTPATCDHEEFEVIWNAGGSGRKCLSCGEVNMG